MMNLILQLSRSALRTAFLFACSLAISSTLQAADYSYSTGAQTLGIRLGTNESLTVTVSGGNIIFALNAGIFFQSGPNGAPGGGTGTTTVSATNVASSLTVNNTVFLAGTNNVTFSGSSSISTGNFGISISGAGVGTVSFTGGLDVAVSTAMNIATNRNISVGSGSQLTATGTAPILLEANQQNTPTSGGFIGIELTGATVQSTGSGALTLRGRGGDMDSEQKGVKLYGTAQVIGGSGTVTVTGTGGASTGSNNYGVFVSDPNTRISSSAGAVLVTGQGGGLGTSGYHFGVFVAFAGEITAGGSGTVTVEGTGGAGTAASNFGVFVRSTDSRITSSEREVRVTGTGGDTAADIFSEADGAITSTSTSAGITLNSTTNGTWPNTASADVRTTPTQTTVFSTGSKLNIDIDGITPQTGYQLLAVDGMIDLTGVELTFNGSIHAPTIGETFIIVNNDGTDAIIGTVTDLPEGATISNFLGSSLDALITYVGGDGNDVVLTVVRSCPTGNTL